MEKNLPQKTTTKKVKYKGTEQFLNLTTGEVEDFQITDIEERDFNFTKVWMRNFISTLDIISNKKTKVAYHIIENINRDNMFIATYEQIQRDTGIGHNTVVDTMKALIDAGFLVKKQNGVYAINPDIIYKGSRSNRLNILHQYHEIGDQRQPLTEEEQIAQYQKTITQLQTKIDKLQKHKIVDAQLDGQLEYDANGNIIERAH